MDDHVVVPRKALIGADDSAFLRRAILDAPGSASSKARLLGELFRVTERAAAQGSWPGGFNMISRDQLAFVWREIRRLKPQQRPQDVRHVFDEVLVNLCRDTNEVLVTRDEISERVGFSAARVSGAMMTLVKLGAMRRVMRRIKGMRGPGAAVYFVNPHVAWNGSLEARERAAAHEKPPHMVVFVNFDEVEAPADARQGELLAP